MADGQTESGFSEALGESEAFLTFQEQVSRAARVDRPVLLLGERGSGKENAAARLHFLSRRWEQPFITLNCAALAPSLIASELFGHEAGAFTGATRRRPGRFEAADGGTLFLDEIGNIPVEVQEMILRVVEYGVFERVGSTDVVRVDVRLIGATNADLPARVREGTFKADLLDRLAFEVVHVPPLRVREGDIELLASHFAARMAYELGREETPTFSDDALAQLRAHHWPGNVRELKNTVERAVFRSRKPEIRRIPLDPFASPFSDAPQTEAPPPREHPAADDTPPQSREAAAAPEAPPAEAATMQELWRLPLREATELLERRRLQEALEEARYNQRRAAELLGLTYHQFRGLYRKHQDELGG